MWLKRKLDQLRHQRPADIGYRLCVCGILVLGSLTMTIHSSTQPSLASQAHADGFLYLSIATNILEGHGATASGNGSTDTSLRHLNRWPVGYPLLVAAIAGATGTSTLAAAKILGAVALCLAGGILIFALGRTTPWVALTLLMYSSVFAFSKAGTEGVLVTALILVAFLTCKTLHRSGRQLHFALAMLGVSIYIAFLLRYHGAFALCTLLFPFIEALRDRRHIDAIATVAVGFVVLLAMVSYWAVASLFGSSTGHPEQTAVLIDVDFQYIPQMSQQVINIIRQQTMILPWQPWARAQWLTLAIPLFGLSLSSIWQWKRGETPTAFFPLTNLGNILVFLAGCYIVSIVFASSVLHFDALNYRLMMPASCLLMLGVLTWCARSSRWLAIFAGWLAVSMAGLTSYWAAVESIAFTG